MPIANQHPKRLRLEAKLSQRRLAELSGVDARTISRFETGGKVSQLTVEKIARGLSMALGRDVSVEALQNKEDGNRKINERANRVSIELSEQAQKMLDALKTNRTFDYPSLTKEVGIETETLRNLMDGGKHVRAEVAKKIIDYIRKDEGEVAAGFSDILRQHLAKRNMSQWEIALPAELDVEDRQDLAFRFASDLVDRYGVVADVAIHAPHRDGDQRNHHAHILTTQQNGLRLLI